MRRFMRTPEGDTALEGAPFRMTRLITNDQGTRPFYLRGTARP